jgi:hypothetical protein
MDELNDTRVLRLPQKPVFVDWRGSRRRLIIAAGVTVSVALGAWLTLIVASIAVVVAADLPSPGGG